MFLQMFLQIEHMFLQMVNASEDDEPAGNRDASNQDNDVIPCAPDEFPDSSQPKFPDGSPALHHDNKVESVGTHAEGRPSIIPDGDFVGGRSNSMYMSDGGIPVSIPTGIAEGFVSPILPTFSTHICMSFFNKFLFSY